MNPRSVSEHAAEVAPLIVGVDGSERSRDALALAVQLAEPGQGVLLAHVHPYGPLSDLLSGDDYARLVREVAESTLSAANETLPPATDRVMQLVSNQSPAAGLHDLAAEKDAALIVVGSSHRSGLGRVLAGSVAESVLAGSPVPVAIATRGLAGNEDGIRIVGCGFDGSPEAHEALGWAADISATSRRACSRSGRSPSSTPTLRGRMQHISSSYFKTAPWRRGPTAAASLSTHRRPSQGGPLSVLQRGGPRVGQVLRLHRAAPGHRAAIPHGHVPAGRGGTSRARRPP